MNSTRFRQRSDRHKQHRSGMAAKEVVLAAVVVLSFTMGLYVLGEKGFSRLYHFISTMVGSPYL
jgi:hypothetical protein